MNLTPEVLSFIFGAFLPPIIDLINKKITDSKVKYLVSVLFCVLVSASTTLICNGFNWGDLVKNASIIFLSAQSMYKLYWKDSSLR